MKWSKILCLEIDISDLKMMVKSGLEFFILKFNQAPSELLLPSAKNPAQKGWIGLAGCLIICQVFLGRKPFQSYKLSSIHAIPSIEANFHMFGDFVNSELYLTKLT